MGCAPSKGGEDAANSGPPPPAESSWRAGRVLLQGGERSATDLGLGLPPLLFQGAQSGGGAGLPGQKTCRGLFLQSRRSTTSLWGGWIGGARQPPRAVQGRLHLGSCCPPRERQFMASSRPLTSPPLGPQDHPPRCLPPAELPRVRQLLLLPAAPAVAVCVCCVPLSSLAP